MPYTPPLGNAVDFTQSGAAYVRPAGLTINFGTSYTIPVGSEANLKFKSGYSVPAGNAADLTWAQAPDSYTANGAFTVEFVVEGHATFTNVETIGNGAFAVDFTVEGLAAHGVAGSGAFAVDFTPAGAAAHGVAGSGAFDVGFSVAGSGIVERYELVGEIRKDGILVNRLVRAYRRDDGSLVGEMTTTGGKFRLHTGFVALEHYIVPIEQGNDATDWSPPVANRVMSVLAQDAA